MIFKITYKFIFYWFWNWCQGKVTASKSLWEYVLLRKIKSMQIKNLSLIWMVKHFTSNKSITIRLYCLKNSLDFIVAIGLSMIPKGPESLIRKSLKTLVNKCLRICTMVTMRQFLPMVKPVQESPVQFKVSQA